jgi:IS30 family transposase
MAMRRSYHRVGYTAAQSAELWERWKRGEGMKSIGRVFDKPSSCIFNHIRPSGGIKPAARRRSRLALTLAEREEISRGLVASERCFACWSAFEKLGRDPNEILATDNSESALRPIRHRARGLAARFTAREG